MPITNQKKIFAFVFSQLQNVYFSNKILKGEKALKRNEKYGIIKQCEIPEPLFSKLSEKAIWKLERMVKGKRIFKFGISKKLRFNGNIRNYYA